MSVGRRMRNVRRDFIEDWRRDHGRCFWCGGDLGVNPQGPALPTIEHFFPRSKGGPNHPENFVVAHKFCNNARGSRLPDEWEMRRFVAIRGQAAVRGLAFFAKTIEIRLSSQAASQPVTPTVSGRSLSIQQVAG